MVARPDVVNFEVVVKPGEHGKSVFDDDAFPNVANIDLFKSPWDRSMEVAKKLRLHHIQVHDIGDFSISASCKTDWFESFFSTVVSAIDPPKAPNAPAGDTMFAPKKGESWTLPAVDGLDKLIDKAYIQHPPVYFADERPIPPMWTDKFRLRVPTDVAQIMRASSVHQRGITGKGIKVVMPDTGFYRHPFFVEQRYNFLAVTARDALDHLSDPVGHGTGECANLFATAPGINFIGVKCNDKTLGFKTAMEFSPDIITNSWGHDVDLPGSQMPNWLKALHLAVLDAVAKGVIVVFSAGNDENSFPASMPEVISVGGTLVDEDLNYSATNHTSGFMSTWFPTRSSPDVCGLCGVFPDADYIILPVQSGADHEREGGWGAFSGTSAAAPMVAGVCALLKQADPDLTPSEVKNLLIYTARDITSGVNAHHEVARSGPDVATGFGLVDAERAIEAVL